MVAAAGASSLSRFTAGVGLRVLDPLITKTIWIAFNKIGFQKFKICLKIRIDNTIFQAYLIIYDRPYQLHKKTTKSYKPLSNYRPARSKAVWENHPGPNVQQQARNNVF